VSNAISIVNRLLEEEGDEEFNPRDYVVGPDRNGYEDRDRRIRISYEQTTPESVEDGDTSDSGWIDEEGVEMDLDEYDWEDELTVAEKAAEYLRSEGATDPSSSGGAGTWYSTGWNTVDYGTGTEESKNYHLKNFTEEEEDEIYNLLKRKTRYGVPN
jgi:hypothetical protein